ncbi:DUF397 domain-containing protein [Streptomyces sp. NK08204]|uniref:DUF397 domain-containing protein n=1 Tax=Streptomyces sp. NK08204 TaxID=2873260 RepID=UPI001CED6798|nr:DUF397 domain-containing protein [Streptomyces sp. NK08204]
MNIDVEEVVTWRTSSYSSGEGGQCVEVAVQPHVVCVRDSKDIDQPAIPVTAAAWAAFVCFAAQ